MGKAPWPGLDHETGQSSKWFLLCQESHAWFFLGVVLPLSAHSEVQLWTHC